MVGGANVDLRGTGTYHVAPGGTRPTGSRASPPPLRGLRPLSVFACRGSRGLSGRNWGPAQSDSCATIASGPRGLRAALSQRRRSRRPPASSPTSALPRPQSSRRHWRTAASARRCRSRAARGGRHPPRYCFLCGIGPRPPGRSNRLALTVRVIGLRGTRSCPAGIRTSPFALGPADLAVVLWRHSDRRVPSSRARRRALKARAAEPTLRRQLGVFDRAIPGRIRRAPSLSGPLPAGRRR